MQLYKNLVVSVKQRIAHTKNVMSNITIALQAIILLLVSNGINCGTIAEKNSHQPQVEARHFR